MLAGLDVAFETFRQVAARHEGGEAAFSARRRDGDACAAGDEIAEVTGSAATLLTAERTALNFLQRLSGIATRARRFVDAAGRADHRSRYAQDHADAARAREVRGARRWRAATIASGLFDAVLIKDNHIRLAGGVARRGRADARVRPDMPIEIEAQSLAEVDEALDAGVETILVDNLSLEQIREAVEQVGGLAQIEISGGVMLERMPDLAATGADCVSVGALTHSAPAIDISFEIEPI